MKTTLTNLLVAIVLCISTRAFSQSEFITRWNLATTGSSPTQITFPVGTSGVVSYSWTTVPAGSVGTGTFTGSAALIHSLPAGATIRLSISPVNFNSISLNVTTGDKRRLLDIEQWGTTAWTTMQKAFTGCSNLQISATDAPDLSGVTNLSDMFSGCVALNSPNLTTWNTASVTDMSYMFSSAYAFNQNIGSWNTANVTNMAAMFANTRMFNQNIGTWNTASVRDMNNMFSGSYAFNQNIGTWNTISLTITSSMFNGALAFNQSLNTWNISSLTDVSAMFYAATAFNQGFSAWNVSGITNMYNMFYGATAFDQSLASWAPHLNPAVIMGRTLDNCGMSVANYDATLIAFNNQGPNGVTLGAANLKYCMAAAERANLAGTKGWTITGDAAAGVITTPAFTAVNAICAGNSLAALPAVSTNSITGSWSPAINNMVTTTYTFTPAVGQCATTVTMAIAVNPMVTPAFAAVNPVCAGAIVSPLPVTSTNSVSGSWSPAINNMVTTNYTFTPSAGQCATNSTMAITVNPLVLPAFVAVNPVCAGAALAPLPLSSTNGVSGSWSPAINNMVTTTYTFTPNTGQCATAPAIMTITVSPGATAVFAAVNPVCAGTAIAPLPTTSANGVTGTWLPAINPNQSTTYTFTPDAGQCSTTATTLAVSVTPTIAAQFTPISSLCVGPNITSLPVPSNNGVSGNWIPAINYTRTTYTFVPTPGQCVVNTATMSVQVSLPPVATTSLNGGSIVAAETGATYQWIDCNNGNAIIANATNQSYTPNRNGSYAVIITKNGCTATSSCLIMTSVGMQDVEKLAFESVIYPNPNHGKFEVSLLSGRPATISVYNSIGQIVYSNQMMETKESIDLSQLPAGIYVIALSIGETSTKQKMVITH